MKNRVDPRALVLSALLTLPTVAARADDAGTPPPSRDPRPVCRARVCPEWSTAPERERVRRRTPAPPPSTSGAHR